MKVKRLIEELSKMNPNASVKITSENGSPVMFVLSYLNNENVVWLQSMDDCNMHDQLESRIDDYKNDMEPEESLFEDLLDHDITIDILNKYIGNGALSQCMAKRYEQYLNTIKGSFN